MKTQVYVNLPVKDLKRADAFFKSPGFVLDPKFSNDRQFRNFSAQWSVVLHQRYDTTF